MDRDVLGSLLIILTVGMLIIISEFLARTQRLSKEEARKLLHITAGNILFFVPLFENKILVTSIPLFFAFVNIFLSPISPIKRIRLKTFGAGHSLGTIFYPISLSFVIWFGFDSLWMTLAAFFPVIYGDGFAAVVGPRAKEGHFKIYNGTKTLIGTLVVSFASWLAVLIGIIILGYGIALAIIVASIIALFAPLVEVLSPKGTDNLLIPPILFGILYLLKDNILAAVPIVNVVYLISSVVLGTVIAIGGYKAGALTNDGALAGFLIAITTLGLNGWAFGAQLFLFFFVGTLATKLIGKKNKKKQDEFEKGSEKRDSKQALAKAGVPGIVGIFYLLFPSEALFYLYSSVFAASLVDTMATEIGIAFKGTARSVLRPWRLAEKGESGAISVTGTLGGLFSGILFTAIIYGLAIIEGIPITSWAYIFLVTLAGMMGMFADSILGTTIQRMNRCIECGKVLEATEHCEKPTEYHKGLKFFKNDLVNLSGTTIGGFWGLLFFCIFF
ncbi:MAG: DUF92 domain-containing protein [Candidatus Heimdallarchaeota archaeon]|nr:DUF92 domain-containing protein [Candidatus Heimdallarchaeota archaeon]